MEAGERDHRMRTARLTAAGLRERALLDRRSDQIAAALIAPLGERQRRRLVDAMAEVERLLTASLVRIAPVDPGHAHARHCLREYVAELDRRFPGGFDPARSISADAPELLPPAGVLLVATLHSEPVGCGALKFHDAAPTEIKRMWIAPHARGLGLGRRLLAELEARAAAHAPSRAVRLETYAALTQAIAMYRSAGYAEVAPFSDEPYAHHWFEKPLPVP